MIAAELIALLGFELDTDTLKKVEDFFNAGETKLKGFGETAAKFLSQGFAAFFAADIYETAKGIATQMLQYLNPVAIAASAREYANIADQIGKGAAALEISTTQFQELSFIAQQAGINAEDVNKSISKIKAGIGEAKNGSAEWQGIFRAIGIDVNELSKLDPSARFDAVVAGLGTITDSTKRAALAQKLFEEQAPKFNTLIQGGAEGLAALRQKANELGAIIPPEDIANAGKLNERFDFLNARLEAIKGRVYGAVVPALERMIAALLQFVEDNGPALQAMAALVGNVLATGFDGLAVAIRFAAQTVAILTGRVKTLFKDMTDVNAALKFGAMLVIAYGAAWSWTQRAALQMFFSSLLVQLKAVAAMLVTNTLAAISFFRTLTLGSVWNAITAGFARLSLALTGTTAQFIIIAGSVLFLLLTLQDLYTWFDGGESIFGDNLGEAGLVNIEQMTFGLMLIGSLLGLLLFMFNPILGLLAILALMVAYIAANWELVLAVFEYVYDSIVDAVSDFMLYVFNGFMGIGNSIMDFFKSIFDFIGNGLSKVGDKLGAIVDRARGLLGFAGGADDAQAGARVAQALAGPGASGPGVDAQAAQARALASRSVTIAPTINLAVDAKDRDAAGATDVVRGAVEAELWRELERAYDGDED